MCSLLLNVLNEKSREWNYRTSFSTFLNEKNFKKQSCTFAWWPGAWFEALTVHKGGSGNWRNHILRFCSSTDFGLNMNSQGGCGPPLSTTPPPSHWFRTLVGHTNESCSRTLPGGKVGSKIQRPNQCRKNNYPSRVARWSTSSSIRTRCRKPMVLESSKSQMSAAEVSTNTRTKIFWIATDAQDECDPYPPHPGLEKVIRTQMHLVGNGRVVHVFNRARFFRAMTCFCIIVSPDISGKEQLIMLVNQRYFSWVSGNVCCIA